MIVTALLTAHRRSSMLEEHVARIRAKGSPGCSQPMPKFKVSAGATMQRSGKAADTEASDFFLDHVRSPCGRGELATATQTASRRNPACGDEVALRMHIEGNTIRGTGFDQRGCSVSLAAASILCEHIQGQAAAAMKTLDPDGMLGLLRIPISPGRRRCALLAYEALRSILASMDADPSDSSS